MKLKKIIGMLLLIIIMTITACSITTTKTYAAEKSYVLGITNVREGDGGAYGIGGQSTGVDKKIWKIVSYPNTGSDVANYNNAFYCIKAEIGFAINNGQPVSDVRKTYDTSFNMKTEKLEVIKRLNDINTSKNLKQLSEEDYNKILWIIDNMYLPKANGAADYKEALLKEALKEEYEDWEEVKDIVGGKFTDYLEITDADIEVVQQLALWYYTNSEDSMYHNIVEGQALLRTLLWSEDDTNLNYKSFHDLYGDDGVARQQECSKLYNYFITNAEKNGNYTSPDSTSPLVLDKSRVTRVKEDSNYIIGPFKINKTSDVLYTLNKLGFTDGNGNKFEYKLLNSSKKEVSGNIESLYGQDFYISVPTDTSVRNIKFNIGITYTKTAATYYTTNDATYKEEQPVVLVERQPVNYADEVTVTIPEPEVKTFDLSLRKFISAVNGVAPQISREPIVDLTGLKTGNATTATYNHPKAPLSVKAGDIITYTVRVYNEGEIDGYVNEITDHLPEELEFLPDDEDNIANGWVYDETDTNLRTIKTDVTSKEKSDTYSENTGIDRANTLLSAYNGGDKLDYIDVKVKCKLKNTVVSGQKITNIADITAFTDDKGNTVTDRDSQEDNVVLPSDENLPNYKDTEINRGDKYIPGQQDDDDFEKVKVQIFDLALRKFITAVDSQNVTNRIPQLSMGENGNIKYTHTKVPVEVQTNNVVTYTLRIFNEGDIDGYASEITDNLPEGLEFLPNNELNKTYRWKMIDKDGEETTDLSKAVKVTTDYLSKDQEKTSGTNLIKAFNKELGITDSNPDYKDVKIAFKVIEPNTSDRILTNTAEISNDTDSNGKPIDDVDSVPGNNIPTEDDIDVEHVKLVYFDLALRKFITKVNNLDINNRIPQLSMGEDGNIKYTHTKDPVEVQQTDIVTYTLRIYNEGKMDGYAKEVTDNLPKGLEFLPDNKLNKTYRWKMIDKDGKETTDLSQAVKITTDYLSKEQEAHEGANLIKAFDKELGITDSNPDYRDVKIAFKVTEPNTSDRIIINTAEISEDADKNNKPVDDIDSVPGNNIPNEDDIDIEKVKVKYFDLALKKWVSKVVVIEDGKETVTDTGHTGDENPEPVVKVDLKSKKLKNVTVKFGYKIKITNEGQIEGYAKEIKDYIPDGLKFVAADNPQWKQLSEKVVVTSQLENTLLKPGESATVDILLTWINGNDNLGLKVNVAEISKDYNESNTPDIDSTPDNKKDGEDDIDDAPVILGIKTGEMRIYVGLTTIVLVTLAAGVILIKKYVL